MTIQYSMFTDAPSPPRTPPSTLGSLPATPGTQERVINQRPKTPEALSSSPLMFHLSPEGQEPHRSPVSLQAMHTELGIQEERTFGAVHRAHQMLTFLKSTPPSPTPMMPVQAPRAPRVEQAPRFQSLEAAFENFDAMDIDLPESTSPSASASASPTVAAAKRARGDEAQNDCDEPAAKRARH